MTTTPTLVGLVLAYVKAVEEREAFQLRDDFTAQPDEAADFALATTREANAYRAMRDEARSS